MTTASDGGAVATLTLELPTPDSREERRFRFSIAGLHFWNHFFGSTVPKSDTIRHRGNSSASFAAPSRVMRVPSTYSSVSFGIALSFDTDASVIPTQCVRSSVCRRSCPAKAASPASVTAAEPASRRFSSD